VENRRTRRKTLGATREPTTNSAHIAPLKPNYPDSIIIKPIKTHLPWWMALSNTYYMTRILPHRCAVSHPWDLSGSSSRINHWNVSLFSGGPSSSLRENEDAFRIKNMAYHSIVT